MSCVIIGIAGGTASGKTTIAKKLYEEAKKHGSVVMIRLDDYYKSLDHLSFEERTKVNYDHPNAYDVDLIISHLNKLKNHQSIDKPIYDFVVHNRSKEVEHLKAASVVIVEGIMTFAIPEICELLDMKIFVDTPDDIRLLRRLKRDMEERGRSFESITEQYLTTVRPMHLLFVEPSKRYADLIVPEGGQNVVAIDVLSTKIKQLINML